MESVPTGGNYQMVIYGICTWTLELSVVICGISAWRWELSNGHIWYLYLEMGTIKWSSVVSVPKDWNCPLLSVESVPRHGNYQIVICGICTKR